MEKGYQRNNTINIMGQMARRPLFRSVSATTIGPSTLRTRIGSKSISLPAYASMFPLKTRFGTPFSQPPAVSLASSRIPLLHHLSSYREVRQLSLRVSSAGRPMDEELAYDSDDYEELDISKGTNVEEHSGEGPSKLSAPLGIKKGRRRKKATKVIKTGVNLFLLFGAAVDRSVSRIQKVLMAVAATSWGMMIAVFRRSPAGRLTRSVRRKMEEVQRDLPEDTWGKLLWLWDRPPVQRLRLTISMANLSIRLPAIMALIATQVGLLASQVSLPMLAPLLLGTGMLMRSIKTNASFLLPRIGILVVLLWILWFANSVVQNTVAYLRKQGALDNRLAGGIITVSECTALLVALVVLLSMLGVNVSALLLPAGIAVAIAAKDLSHNFLAGFFLFVVQPFKLGDRLAIPSSFSNGGFNSFGNGSSLFEGVCEKVDLRYTVVRQGRRRLVIPNSAFLTREFMIVEESPTEGPTVQPSSSPSTSSEEHAIPYMTADHRHVWQYVQGPPVHHEVAAAAASGRGMGIAQEGPWNPSQRLHGHSQPSRDQQNPGNMTSSSEQHEPRYPPSVSPPGGSMSNNSSNASKLSNDVGGSESRQPPYMENGSVVRNTNMNDNIGAQMNGYSRYSNNKLRSGQEPWDRNGSKWGGPAQDLSHHPNNENMQAGNDTNSGTGAYSSHYVPHQSSGGSVSGVQRTYAANDGWKGMSYGYSDNYNANHPSQDGETPLGMKQSVNYDNGGYHTRYMHDPNFMPPPTTPMRYPEEGQF